MQKFDFQSVKARIIRNLQSKTSTANLLPFGTNARIIDTVAEAIAELARFDSYLTRENKWSLAQNRSSLMLQADILSYRPKRKVSAVGSVRVSLHEDVVDLTQIQTWNFDRFYLEGTRVAYENQIYEARHDVHYTSSSDADKTPANTSIDWELIPYSATENVPIPRFTVFSEPGGMEVATVSDTVLLTNDAYVELEVYQGTPKTENRQAVGQEYEEIFIQDADFAEANYWVWVNGVEYAEVDDLRLAESGQQVYEIRNDPNAQGVIFRFGNDVFGKRLSFEDAVQIQYIATEGVKGNITSSNILNEVVSDIEFETLGSADVFVINEFPIVGGQEPESLEDIRTNAPRFFQTGGRATSADDYIAIIEDNFDFVSRVAVWGAYEENADNNRDPGEFIAGYENRVWVSAFTTGGLPLNTNQENMIQDKLNSLKAPTDILSFEPAEIVGMIFDIEAIVRDRSFTIKQVESNISAGVFQEYDIENLRFAQNLYGSDFTAFIDGIRGVAYHNSTVAFTETRTLTTGFASPTFTLAHTNIITDTVKIYMRNFQDETEWFQVGHAEQLGSGDFTLVGSNGYSLANSTFNPVLGRVRVNVSGGIFEEEPTPIFSNYETKVEYMTENKNYPLRKRNQIYRLDEANISVRYE